MKKIIFTFLMVLLLPVMIYAQFTGGNYGGDISSALNGKHLTNWFKTAGNWSTASNWDDGVLPASSEDAYIKAAAVIDNDYSYPNLAISVAGSVTISPAKSLTVTGTLTNNAGTGGLAIQSSGSGTGSLIHSTASVNATVQRYIADAIWTTWDDGWHFLSSPVSAQAINPAFTVTPEAEYDFYTWYEPENVWVNFKNTSTAPTWGTANNASTNFLVGKGYLVAYKTASTKTFTGVLNVGNVSYSNLTVSSGVNNSWHLLGNPFTSAVTWDLTGAWAKTAIGGVANIWDEVGKSYQAINDGDIIPSGNGFMVYVSSSTNSITIPASKRTHSLEAWYKSTEYPVVTLVAKNLDNPSYQECQVRFNPVSTSDFDLEYDGKYLAGYAPLFYSMSNGDKLMVNSMPVLNSQTSVPFSFIKNNGTSFVIETLFTDNFPNSVYLKDLKTGIDQNLIQDPVYNFTSVEGDNPARFLLHFGGLIGLEEKPDEDPVRIYASGHTLIINSLTGSILEGKVTIFNFLGQRVLTRSLDKNQSNRIALDGLDGYFLVKLINNKQIYSTKVLIH